MGKNERLTEAEAIEAATKEISKVLGISSPPIKHWVHRWDGQLPQFKLGHKDLLTELEESLKTLPGLYLCGAAYTGVGIPDCIKQGKDAAEEVLKG